MRPRALRRRLTLAAFGAILAGATIGTGIAKADPQQNYAAINAGPICSVLDDYPSIAGVTGVLQGVQNDSGFTPYQAGQSVAEAVIGWCPRHLALLKRYIQVYAPDAAPAATVTDFGPVRI